MSNSLLKSIEIEHLFKWFYLKSSGASHSKINSALRDLSYRSGLAYSHISETLLSLINKSSSCAPLDPNANEKERALYFSDLNKTILKIRKIESDMKLKISLKNINLNFSISEEGEIVGLFGENGSGKSTMMKLFSLQHLPNSGTINLFGTKIDGSFINYSLERRKISSDLNLLIGGEFGLMSKLSVEENIEYFTLSNRRLLDRKKLDKFLRETNLFDFYNGIKGRSLESLSKGQKQKVKIIFTFFSGGTVFAIDEPFVGLDLVSLNSTMDLIKSLSQSKLIILTMHEIASLTVEKLDRLIIIKDGFIIRDYKKSFLKNKIQLDINLEFKIPLSLAKSKEIEQNFVSLFENLAVREKVGIYRNYSKTRRKLPSSIQSTLVLDNTVDYEPVISYLLEEIKKMKLPSYFFHELKVGYANLDLFTYESQ